MRPTATARILKRSMHCNAQNRNLLRSRIFGFFLKMHNSSEVTFWVNYRSQWCQKLYFLEFLIFEVLIDQKFKV